MLTTSSRRATLLPPHFAAAACVLALVAAAAGPAHAGGGASSSSSSLSYGGDVATAATTTTPNYAGGGGGGQPTATSTDAAPSPSSTKYVYPSDPSVDCGFVGNYQPICVGATQYMFCLKKGGVVEGEVVGQGVREVDGTGGRAGGGGLSIVLTRDARLSLIPHQAALNCPENSVCCPDQSNRCTPADQCPSVPLPPPKPTSARPSPTAVADPGPRWVPGGPPPAEPDNYCLRIRTGNTCINSTSYAMCIDFSFVASMQCGPGTVCCYKQNVCDYASNCPNQ
ncbi:hypothetical protein DFJ73DRAFT_962313 [Zopfochytrium polystomum]|nr:hypothetical protein DFJ73DRAFT_962313 [Zopfochytrium polystomum]